ERGSHSKPSLREIQSISNRSPHIVIRNPAHVGKIHPTLQHQVFYQSPDWIVRERRNHRRAHPKAAPQSTRHVVLAAAFPDAELASRRASYIARIEPQHHLAEAHQIPTASSLFSQRQSPSRFRRQRSFSFIDSRMRHKMSLYDTVSPHH